MRKFLQLAMILELLISPGCKLSGNCCFISLQNNSQNGSERAFLLQSTRIRKIQTLLTLLIMILLNNY